MRAEPEGELRSSGSQQGEGPLEDASQMGYRGTARERGVGGGGGADKDTGQRWRKAAVKSSET